MTVAYDQPRTSTGHARRIPSSVARWALPAGGLLGLAFALESVRLTIRTPSLIDDWFGITYSRAAFHALAGLNYGSAHVDFAGRYRPGYAGFWNYLQWHLIGEPSVSTAAAWGALRAAAFLFAVWLLARWIRQGTSAPTPLLWLAPAAVALTPRISLDLVRHGSADPIMVTGLIVGLGLVAYGLQGLLESRRVGIREAAALSAGYLVYLVGVYTKEASVCVLLFLPFFLKWVSPAVRTRVSSSQRARHVATAATILLALPIVHVGAHVGLAVLGGENPYPNAQFTLGSKVLASLVFPLIGAPGPLGTLLWVAATPIALMSVVLASRQRERDAWLLSGILATGFLMSAFSLVRGDTPSRYYIPWVIAIAVVAVRALARTGVMLQVAVAAVIIVMGLTGTRNSISRWAALERSGSAAVELAASSVAASCPTYLANFDVERRVAIPRLLGFANIQVVPACTQPRSMAYALSWQDKPLPSTFAGECRVGWQKLKVSRNVAFYRCEAMTARVIPDQDSASSSPNVSVVRLKVPAAGKTLDTFNRPALGG